MANNPFDPPIVQVKKTLNRGGLGTVNRGYGSLKSSTQKTRQAPPAEQPEWWPENLSELGDVDTVTNPPTAGQALTWNSLTEKWEPEDAAAGSAPPDYGSPLTTALGVPGFVLDGSVTTATAVTNGLQFFPMLLVRPTSISELQVEVSTSGAGNIKTMIYTVTDSSWTPGALVWESGDVSMSSTGRKSFTPGSPISLLAGRYLLAMWRSGAGVVRGWNGPSPWQAPTGTAANQAVRAFNAVTVSYGAAPDPGPAFAGYAVGAGMYHCVLVKTT